MNLLERIKQSNKERLLIQSQLKKISEYYKIPYDEMYHYYHAMKPKQAEKFIEGWVANLLGGKKIDNRQVPEKYKKNDIGDIQGTDTLTIGENNIELKASFKHDSGIGGGQLRLYEPVPYYLFFKSWSETEYEMFLLTKDQLVYEIKQRATDTGMSAYTSSQGSGDISQLSNEQKIHRLDENLNRNKFDKIGWGFNPKTEQDYYQYFKEKYQMTAEQIYAIFNK